LRADVRDAIVDGGALLPHVSARPPDRRHLFVERLGLRLDCRVHVLQKHGELGFVDLIVVRFE
jgi:hypothetical protein